MHRSFTYAAGALLMLTATQGADAQQTNVSAIAPFVKAMPYPTQDVDMSTDADLKTCAMKTLIKLAPAGSEFSYRKHESGTSFFSVLEVGGMHYESNIYIKDGKSGPASLQTGTYNVLKKYLNSESIKEDVSVAVNGNKGILMQPVTVEDFSAYTPQQSDKNYIHSGVNAAAKKSIQMYDEMRLCMPKLVG